MHILDDQDKGLLRTPPLQERHHELAHLLALGLRNDLRN